MWSQTLQSSIGLLALMAVHLAPASAEKVLGVYIYSRHGDRSAKVSGNTHLTDLGYREVFLSGTYYHDRYITSNSSLQIAGIDDSVINPKQVAASAPDDGVLQNSATGFMQGVYPPVGASAAQTLRNGSTVEAPLNGYQLVTLATVSTGTNSENTNWLQSANDCQKSEISSNAFYSSPLYISLSNSTKSFYQSLAPMLTSAFTESQLTFKNAYTIFDYLNVASIHNSSSDFPSADLLTSEVYQQLLLLANVHEFNLAYNQSEQVRAIAGSVLAGQVLTALNETITSQGKSKLNVQFGAYATFLSYFGLAQLVSMNDDFTGIPDYASTMTWELVTNSTSDAFPDPSEISVRFLFHNGTIADSSSGPIAYPLFGQSNTLMSWSDFSRNMLKIAVTSQDEWCSVCGNTQGVCASDNGSSPTATTSKSSGHGMALGVAGVIGAMVTLGVIIGLEFLIFLLGGFRISRKRAGSSIASPTAVVENKA